MDDYERAATRRELLRLGVAAGVAAVWAPRGVLWGWSQAPLAPTTPTTPGPFYPIIRPRDRDSDLTLLKGHTKRAQGQVIDLVGRVLNARGEPVRVPGLSSGRRMHSRLSPFRPEPGATRS